MFKKIIFSAALPPLLIAGVSAALDIMEQDSSLRERLWDNVRYLAKACSSGRSLDGNETASVPIAYIASMAASCFLHPGFDSRGIFTFPAVYPTVPKNKSVFRLALQTRHEKKDLDHVIDVFDRLLAKYGVKVSGSEAGNA
ncbi:MAG: hypothetical protein R3B54_03630 [Bdellovibrionota bacterium]